MFKWVEKLRYDYVNVLDYNDCDDKWTNDKEGMHLVQERDPYT